MFKRKLKTSIVSDATPTSAMLSVAVRSWEGREEAGLTGLQRRDRPKFVFVFVFGAENDYF